MVVKPLFLNKESALCILLTVLRSCVWVTSHGVQLQLSMDIR